MSRRAQLLTLIDQDLQRDRASYPRLQALMQDLYQQLLLRDCASIDALNTLILERLGPLQIHARRRSRVLLAFGLEPGDEGMDLLIRHFIEPARRRVRSNWQTVAEGVLGCQRLNERNGELLSMHNDVLSQLLGGGREHFLYSPHCT